MMIISWEQRTLSICSCARRTGKWDGTGCDSTCWEGWDYEIFRKTVEAFPAFGSKGKFWSAPTWTEQCLGLQRGHDR